MERTVLKRSMIVLVLFLAAGLIAVQPAHAWWGCCSYASYYAPVYGPSYYSTVSCCDYPVCYPVARRYYRACNPCRRVRWDPCCCDYCSCGSCCYSCNDSCYGAVSYAAYSTGCCGSVDVSPSITPAPAPVAPTPRVLPDPPTSSDPADITPPLPEPTTSNSAPDRALLVVDVPAEAKVMINGRATTSTGSNRSYFSRGLSSGHEYTYRIRTEITRDGQQLEQTKVIVLRAGETSRLAFSFDQNDARIAAVDRR